MARATRHRVPRRVGEPLGADPPRRVGAESWSVFGATLDGIFVVAVVVVFGSALLFSPPVRPWALSRLGYGWIPVGIWLVPAMLTLRYRHQSLAQRWRWWAGSAALVAISIGALSLFKGQDGVLAQASLGGYWGAAFGGRHLAVGIGKLAAIALFTPLLLAPPLMARVYWRALQAIGLALHCATTSLHLFVDRLAHFVYPRLRLALSRRYRRRWLRRTRAWLNQPFPVLPGRRKQPDAATMGLSSTTLKAMPTKPETPNLFAETDPGTIPDWETRDSQEGDDPEGEKGPRNPSISPLIKRGLKGGLVGGSKWHLPSMEILSVAERHEPPQAQLQQMARHIESTLGDHGVTVEVKDIKAGPRVVRFGLVPGWVSKKGEASKAGPADPAVERTRVKVQSILIREKDLALALKTPYLRIEAPVPGEALVGLEVPNPSPTKVPLRSVMSTSAFKKIASKGGLPIALGQDATGNSVVTDLAALPHILIAGATGSGKSVCINSIIASVLLTKPPDQLRILMVDPKRVELTPFNGVPHLIAPVIVETDEVNPALRALMREMFHRYKQMEEIGARNISGYNAKSKDRIPYLVLIVDELADLMMIGGFEVEQNLVRLAQLGRATGIHLVLATQRPSVNVVTGLLKANIPTRVAFAVASQVDSRVILDTIGAEKLLGKGDMLLLNHDSPKPRRVQGTLITDEEIEQLVDFWHNQKGPPLPVIPIDEPWDEAEQEGADDKTLDQARELAIRNPRLSASFLERRLKVGGHRAEQIIEELEDEGLIIPQ